MNERIQVHHNYISTISKLEHKKDLINRLKGNDPPNIPAYEAEMMRQMTLHEDVLGRLLTILKQVDYYRTLEELPVIDILTTYDDIKLFPEVYDTITIIERVTSEADLIKRQLKQPGMYVDKCMTLLQDTNVYQPCRDLTSQIHRQVQAALPKLKGKHGKEHQWYSYITINCSPQVILVHLQDFMVCQ